jgi:hypothetical protein
VEWIYLHSVRDRINAAEIVGAASIAGLLRRDLGRQALKERRRLVPTKDSFQQVGVLLMAQYDGLSSLAASDADRLEVA